MNTLIKIISLLIYPFFITILAFLIFRKKDIRNIFKNNYKNIIINSLIFSAFLIILTFILFKFEDTIYFYDYSGYWIKSLELKKMFSINPIKIYTTVYNSMLYDDYSYLPSLFLIPSMYFGSSFKYFIFSNIISFMLPLSIIIQIVYFKYFKNKYLILISLILFYPLYFSLYNGDVSISGLLVVSCILILINFDFDLFDAAAMNFLIFILIFLRRWYLFLALTIYICLFLKLLLVDKRKFRKAFTLILASGIILSFIIICFFFPFLKHLLFNNIKEAYTFYNRNGKSLEFINYYSPLILIVCLYSIIKLFKTRKTFILIISIIIPYFLFTRIQALEYHHYHLFNLQMFILFTYAIASFKKINLLIVPILLVQISLIPINIKIPIFTSIKRIPHTLTYKKDIQALSEYLVSISPEAWQSSYLASGSPFLNDDMIRNSLLPNIDDIPKIDSAVLDLRDGFPKDLKYVTYVVIIDPIQYLNPKHQRIYDVISNAIVKEPKVSKIYNKLKSFKIGDLNVTVYEKVGEFDNEIKQYFYQKMIEFYPNHQEFFKYILD